MVIHQDSGQYQTASYGDGNQNFAHRYSPFPKPEEGGKADAV